jgi:hypothetical protein
MCHTVPFTPRSVWSFSWSLMASNSACGYYCVVDNTGVAAWWLAQIELLECG